MDILTDSNPSVKACIIAGVVTLLIVCGLMFLIHVIGSNMAYGINEAIEYYEENKQD